ncbi:MAG: SAM-dependent methyltransferase [Candidatus Anammoximicrobium sp.]|nr:SAM-dependent methyltransferase [Candidatus Anammoximicrobium sp.]
MQQEHGQDKFYSFYRHFLLRLFHEGLGQPPAQRNKDLDDLLGVVPYLNGGLFDVHKLEERNREITIPDKAFERLFDFFDAYQWHLDERPLRADNEINPDVLGYIFEKYINQKQMGAYYTKEDITGYIAQNTVIPFLFDAAKKKCPAAFQPHSPMWGLLREDPDRYIYAAVRHGVDVPLPKAVAAGLNNVSKRDGWNQAAPGEFALPTETWREHVTRRNRCLELRRKLAASEIHSINDLITLNLDIRQFAQDAVENCESPELLRAYYRAISSVSVLDPTCGSGAFLFAALNILEPLYEACLERMQAFLDELPSRSRGGAGIEGDAPTRPPTAQPSTGTSPEWLAAEDATIEASEPKAESRPAARTAKPKQFSDFRSTLAEVAKHPSPRYFILKSIIIGNLYGVDIMEEAVEICKLRLFLKLVAQVNRLEQIEPLPDVDFNIRAGNTLVGYVSLDQIRQAVERERGGQKKLAFSDAQEEVAAIEEKALIADRAYQRFREMQTEQGMDASQFTEAKRELRRRLDTLGEELDRYLAAEYGVVPRKREAFAAWLKSYQPFHWFAEFYGIMHRGGFDVIIGNPPYVEIREVVLYETQGFSCANAGNLYALVLERCSHLCEALGQQGFIVPVSSVSTDRYTSLQSLLCNRRLCYSSFDDRPSRLFDGLEHIRLTVHLIGSESAVPTLHSTRYNKWNTNERASLFERLRFSSTMPAIVDGSLPKLCCELELRIIEKLTKEQAKLADFYVPSGNGKAYYSRKVGYFLQVLNFEPRVLDGRGQRRPPSEFKELTFADRPTANLILCCLNSNLFYWFVTVFSDCRHVNKREVDAFPINIARLAAGRCAAELSTLADELMADIKANSEERTMRFRHDTLTVQCIVPKASKPFIDAIDRSLAAHYGFTDEELDFIINYDVKYRMGQDDGDDEE